MELRQKSQKNPVIVSERLGARKLTKIPLNSNIFHEEWLQRLIEVNPDILTSAEIDGVFTPMVCIGREVPTNAGPIDNLYISPQGYLIIVETKLWRNPEARRKVVGQILDYAKEVRNWSYSDLDLRVKSYLSKTKSEAKNLFDYLVSLNLVERDHEALFIDSTEKNILASRFLLMIVGDGIRDGVVNMVSFLNENPYSHYSLVLLELEIYEMENQDKLIVPNTLLRTVNVERGIIRIENLASTSVRTTYTSDPLRSTREDSSLAEPEKEVIDNETQETFLKKMQDNAPEIDIERVSYLLEDLKDLGLSIEFSKHCAVRFKLTGTNKYIALLYLRVEGQFFTIAINIVENLVRNQYSVEAVNTYLKEMTPFFDSETQKKLSVDLLSNIHAKGKIMELLDHKQEFLLIIERFIANFQ